MGIQYHFMSLSDKGIEIDYGGGISPKWKNFTFTVGGLEYTYPSDTQSTISS